jgi:hypothetical protein
MAPHARRVLPEIVLLKTRTWWPSGLLGKADCKKIQTSDVASVGRLRPIVEQTDW